MEIIDEKNVGQIIEEANIILENIRQAIPENSRSMSVLLALAQALKSIARYINESNSEVKMKKLVLYALDVIKDDEESAQSQI